MSHVLTGSTTAMTSPASGPEVGGWLVRLLRRRAEPAERPLEPSATAFVLGWWQSLPAGCLFVLLFGLIFLVPVVIAGWVDAHLGGVGAMGVALLLPVVLATDMLLLIMLFG